MKEKIIIYTNEDCGYCKEVKKAFENKKLNFTEVSVKEYPKEWNKVMVITGMGITPTILFKDNYFVPDRDFNYPNQITEILSNFEKPNGDDVILERIKTLSYNIVFALRTMDKVIKEINKKLN